MVAIIGVKWVRLEAKLGPIVRAAAPARGQLACETPAKVFVRLAVGVIRTLRAIRFLTAKRFLIAPVDIYSGFTSSGG